MTRSANSTKRINARVRFVVTPHEKPRAVHSPVRDLDFSAYVTAAQRSKALQGSSVGTWSVSLAFDQRDPVAIEAERNLLRYVRDDDWGELEFMRSRDGGPVESSAWDIMVTDTGQSGVVNDADGAVYVTYSVSGEDWARCLTAGQMRFSRAFEAAAGRRIPGVISGKQWDLAVKVSLEQIQAGGTGAILRRNAEGALANLLGTVLGGAGLRALRNVSDTIDPKPASALLRNLLTVLLAETWHHPTKGSLLERMVWERFGPVGGSPWKLNQLSSQRTVTPDSLLRQFGMTPYNEIWYGYVTAAGGRRLLAPVFREHPYQRNVWNRLPIHNVSGSDIAGDRRLGRSGAERFTFWRPQSALGALSGLDLFFTIPEELPGGKTRQHQIPIVYEGQIKRHGLRPIEPTDDYLFFGSDPRIQYAKRIRRFSNWMSNNPEMVTGTVKLDTLYPEISLGERVALPIPWSFLLWKGKSGPTSRDPRVVHDAAGFDAYVTGINESVTVMGEGAVVASTTLSVTRGQPRGGSFREHFAQEWEAV